MKKPSKIKDVIIDWKVDSQQLSQDLIKKYQWDISFSTSKEKLSTNLHDEFKQLFELAVDEEFEDGFESLFSRSLVSFIEKYDKKAIEALTPIFINEQINPEITAEALRWIGRIEHIPTHNDRQQLLERCLCCSSPYIRDGAALGIASMNDPHAIPSLKLAIKKETIFELRKDMKQVLFQLESDGNGADNENHS
jgi:hypothetical protein